MIHPNFSLHFFLILLASLLPSSSSLNHDTEILLKIKNQIITDPNHSLTNWIPSPDSPCNWTGIKCDSKFSVISINLDNLDISSNGFPSDFCQIPTLQTLSLNFNNLANTMSSSSISHCSHLHHLFLNYNLFVGTLPDFPTTFPNLLSLDLSGNNFTGDIPPSFGWSLPNLQVLRLTSNLLTGTIPSFLANLTELTHLDLAYNSQLTPSQLPPEIGNLTKLRTLWFTDVNLIGPIPDSIGRLQSLTNLDVSHNSISGTIPNSIGNMKNLRQIELYNNQISGELPESLGNLMNLDTFDACCNNLTGKLPEKLAALQLSVLHIQDNHLEGEIPAILGSNRKLEDLKLFKNRFSGVLPADLGRYSPLEIFDVSTNQLVGKLPPFLCAGNKLVQFITFKNQLSGDLPESIAECKSLQRIRICNNEFSGKIPDSFWGLPRVGLLEMCNNGFEGTISPAISDARNLTQLIIDGNNFSGEIPKQICGLSALGKLDASRNRFSGELPSCITGLKNLQNLDLQQNKFSGNFPSRVARWIHLTELNVSGNKFSGRIPSDLGKLPVLNYLDLSDNLFSGEIPNDLTCLKLNSFNFSGNQLEGRIPPGFDTDYYISSLAGNPKLCSSNLKAFPKCTESKRVSWFLIAVIVCSLLFLLISAVWFFKSKQKKISAKAKSQWKLTSYHKMGINEEEIFRSLRDENLIGTGSSGKVYRAILKSTQTVAVKKLWSGSGKPETEAVFMSEVDTLGKIRHGNIVKLFFSCTGEDFRVLVYEYMENGSLGDVLHSEKIGALLDWPKRFTIAVGAAQGLAYLHHDCVPAIVHRDVKSNNILLDECFQPKVADFGLAKILQNEGDKDENVASRVAGSYGYIAPEYAYTLKVTEKSDVYSFGVVLMELLTGKRPTDPSFGDKNKDIVKWVTGAALTSQGNESGCKESSLRQIMDSRMKPSSCDYEEMEKVLNVALLCTSAFPLNRPSMRKVVDLLKNHKHVNNPAIGA